MPGDLARRPVLGPVQAMNGVDLVRSQHLSDARYNRKLVGSPYRCSCQEPAQADTFWLSGWKINTCAEAKLFLSRSPTWGPTSQTPAAECFRSKATLFLTRRWRRRF